MFKYIFKYNNYYFFIKRLKKLAKWADSSADERHAEFKSTSHYPYKTLVKPMIYSKPTINPIKLLPPNTNIPTIVPLMSSRSFTTRSSSGIATALQLTTTTSLDQSETPQLESNLLQDEEDEGETNVLEAEEEGGGNENTVVTTDCDDTIVVASQIHQQQQQEDENVVLMDVETENIGNIIEITTTTTTTELEHDDMNVTTVDETNICLIEKQQSKEESEQNSLLIPETN